MTKRKEILGRGIFDVFPDNPNDQSAYLIFRVFALRDVAHLRKRLSKGLSDKCLPLQHSCRLIDALRECNDPAARLIVARWDDGRRTGIGQEALGAPEIQRLKEIVTQLRLKGDRRSKTTPFTLWEKREER